MKFTKIEDPDGNVYEVETDETLEKEGVPADAAAVGKENKKILELIANKMQLTPKFANSIDELNESGDTTKMYVLPDGDIYYYSDGSEAEALYTNKLPISVGDDGEVYNGVGYKKGVRYSTSNTSEKDYERACITGWIHVYSGDVIRLKNMPISALSSADSMANAIYCANEAKTTQWTVYSTIIQDNLAGCEVDEGGNVTQFIVPSGCNWIRFASTSIDVSSIVTVNEEIESSGTLEKGWHNSGRAFVPADYEDRIITLENVLLSTVHGIVDDENNILLAGDLAKGTYTIKYVNTDGTTTEVCSFEVE